jgi:hypothetical protein
MMPVMLELSGVNDLDPLTIVPMPLPAAATVWFFLQMKVEGFKKWIFFID